MSHFLQARRLAPLALLSALAASAQTPPPSGAAPPPYRSALEGYQPFKDEPVRPWKDSNDTVRRAGGWKAYAREAQSPAADTPVQPAAADPHSGHAEKAR